jgi:hypothetical protein
LEVEMSIKGKKFKLSEINEMYPQVVALNKYKTVVMPATARLGDLKKELEAQVKKFAEHEVKLIKDFNGVFSPDGSQFSIPENFEEFNKQKEALTNEETFIAFLPLDFKNVIIEWTGDMWNGVKVFLDPSYVALVEKDKEDKPATPTADA